MSIDDQLHQQLDAVMNRDGDVAADRAADRLGAQRRLHRRRVASIVMASTILVVAVIASVTVFVVRNDTTPSRVDAPPSKNGTTPSTALPATTAPAQPAASAPGSIPQDLTFTGRYPGHITTAEPANSGEVLGPHTGPDPSLPPACTSSLPSATGSAGAVIGIVATLNGQRLLFSYAAGNINDPSHGVNETTAQIGNARTFGPSSINNLTLDPTDVVVDPDRSGAQVDSDLYYYAAGSPVIVGHVSGHFRCSP